MSAGEKSEKTSSADSGSSQNYRTSSRQCVRARPWACEGSYAGPIRIVGGDLLGIRQAENALLEAELGVGRAHGSLLPFAKHHGWWLWSR